MSESFINMNGFIQYCNSYYGIDGIYDMNATLEQIKECCYLYLNIIQDEFEGDTIDRERVRDLLWWKYNLVLDPTS